MKKLLALLIFLFPLRVFGAAYSSNVLVSGNWDAAGSWNPAGVPGAGDSVTITAGDIIILRDNRAIGTGGAAGTYDVDILGQLRIDDSVGNVTFSPSTSIRIQNGGIFTIGTSGDRIDCDQYVIVDMQTAVANKYYLLVEDGGEFRAFGCEGWPSNGANTIIRSRIASCNPNCNAGAVTLTLEDDVAWSRANTNPVTVGGTGNPEVIIGSGGNTTAPGGHNSELVEITGVGPAANQIDVTLGNNHQVGDIVANPSRNILFTSNNAAAHSFIRSDGGEYYLSWFRGNEIGDGGTATTSGVGFSDSVKNMGTIDYSAITNCEDGAGVNCFHIYAASWDSFDYNIAYDFSTGRGVYIEIPPTTAENIEDITGWVTASTYTNGGYGISSDPGNTPVNVYESWTTDSAYGVHGGLGIVQQCLTHNNRTRSISFQGLNQYYDRIRSIADTNEIRNGNYCVDLVHFSLDVMNNDFDNCTNFCLYLTSTIGLQDVYSYNNTYDGCNSGNIISRADINMPGTTNYLYSMGDSFGVVTATNRSHIIWNTEQLGSTYQGSSRIIINEPTFGALANAYCGDDICVNGNTWTDYVGIGINSFASVHNEDGVANSHWTLGPGGMVIEKETGTIVDGTLGLKVTPFAADRYSRIPLGKIGVANGDNLTVVLQIRKNETVPAGSRPRLVLLGSGIDSTIAYDEMSDVNNTWEEVTVSGTANAQGAVHVYLEVRGKQAPAGVQPYEPVDPPTLVIYADAISYTKT